MKANIKSKVKAKVKDIKAEVKGKVKGKCKGGKCCAALALLLALCAGCMDTNPASRQTTADYGDIVVKFSEGCSSNYVSIVIGDGAIASAASSGSTETQTASPTQTTDVKPDVDVSVPVIKGAAANAAADLIGATASALKGTGTASGDCSGGNCSTGTCTDGSCSD